MTRWVDSIVNDWNFTTIIPCHFTGPIRATPREFKDAFAFFYDTVNPAGPGLFDIVFNGAKKFSEPEVVAKARIERSTERFRGSLKDAAGPFALWPPQDRKTLDTLFDFLLKNGIVDPNPEAK